MQKELFFRDCPKCKKRLRYTNKRNRNAAIKKNSICGSCAAQVTQNRPDVKEKRAIYSIYLKEAMIGKGNPFFGRKHSKDTIAKIQKNRDKRTFKTKEFKDKMSKVTSGRNNPMYGRTYYDVWVEKYGKEEADKKMAILSKKKSLQTSGKNNPMYGKPSPQGSGNGWSGWYKDWFFRSIKELSYMINVIEVGDLKWRTAETNDLAIKYISHDGNERTYRADFLIDEKTLVEVKPKKLMETPLNVRKKEAAVKFCKKNNYEYSITDVKLLDINDMVSLYDNKQIKFTKRYEEKYKKFIQKKNKSSDQ